jgi:hypothetical protein
MFLYNVTIGIDREVEEEWLKWIKEKHIPDVMGTGMFVQYKMYKVLHDSEDNSVSYSIQYFALSIELVAQYLEVFAPRLSDEHMTKFKDKHVAFRTLLQEI